MSFNLRKGQKIDLTKTNPKRKRVFVRLGWNTEGKIDIDLDTSAFLLGSDGKVTSEDDFIFYNNLKHKSGAVEHMGDNLITDGGGSIEEIKIELQKVPPEIIKIAFAVTIYESVFAK